MSMLNRIHRRTFLERTVMGAGGVLLSSTLLESCVQDHNIPDPQNPDIPPVIPPLGDSGDTWNNDTRLAVTSGLQLIPDVGGLVSSIVSIFWPTEGDSPWDQVKAQVQALIDQSNQQLVLSDQQADLDALKTFLSNYKAALNAVDWGTITTWPLPDDPTNKTNQALAYVLSEWNKADQAFTAALPHFQLTNYEAVLLPLFAQFANLYLAFYRDPLIGRRLTNNNPTEVVPYGLLWGMTKTQIDLVLNTLKNAASLTDSTNGFTPYVTKWYTSYLSNLQNKKLDTINNEPFTTANAYSRNLTMSVLDYMDTWQYYDINLYPVGAITTDGTPIPLFTREIYSDPSGNTYRGNSSPQAIDLPTQATQLPTNITVWGGNQIDAVQLTYPGAGGPGGLNQTPRLGDQKGGTNQPPHGGQLTLDPTNPIIKYHVTTDWEDTNSNIHEFQGIDTMYFVYSDGSHSSTFGKNAGQFATDEVGYDGYALSSIYIQGPVWLYDNTANCIVFGFLRWSSPSVSMRAVARTYITNPREYSAADLAKAFPKFGLSANSISEELKAARKTYWEQIKARVK